jgi:hypothetical protein
MKNGRVDKFVKAWRRIRGGVMSHLGLDEFSIELTYRNVKPINHHVWDRFNHGLSFKYNPFRC